MFKECSSCFNHWKTREDFLADPDVSLLGYQVHFEDLETGWFMFNHKCGTTLAFTVATFSSLYDGPVFTEHIHESGNCPDYCRRSRDLSPCPLQCECAYVRELIQIIKNWPKKS
jgi:hypothetical protein